MTVGHDQQPPQSLLGFNRLACLGSSRSFFDPLNDVLCDPVEYGPAQEINIRRSASGAAASLRHSRFDGLHDRVRQAMGEVANPDSDIENSRRHQ
jgi:hypothetical protein